jgi:hypothetical protein
MRRNNQTDIYGQLFTPAQPKCRTRPGSLPFCPGTLRACYTNVQAMLAYCMRLHGLGHIPQRRRHLPDPPLNAARTQVDAKKEAPGEAGALNCWQCFF